MNTWESMTAAYNNYIKKHVSYVSVGYSDAKSDHNALLHPVLVMSQYIIDALVLQGKKRVAIVLPDDHCSIISLIVAKYFQNLQEDPYYASNIFENINPGQHVKLLNAVAEFLEIDSENQKIKYKVGKETKLCGPMTITTPIANYHLLLEKTGADVSSQKAWMNAVTKVKEQDPNKNLSLYLGKFKQKRTGVRKSIVVLGQKNDVKTQLEIFSSE